MQKENNIDTSMFWSIHKTLTYNYLINIIVGNRGGGKTYGFKEWAVDDFIKKKRQFGYIRRYKEDLQKSMPTYFNDIKHQYPDYEFKVEGNRFYIRLKSEDENQKWTNDDIAGYGFVLSTANNLKSIAFPNISKLCFDEFILDKGNQRYLSDEVGALLNLYETIARPGTNHIRVRLFLLANAITITNPYFDYWDLKMPIKQDRNGKWIRLYKDLGILVEDVRNENFIDNKKNTEFGRLVEGTRYGDFSIANKFYLDDETFIEKKSEKAKYYFTFKYKDKNYGVWISANEGKLWVSEDVDPSYLLTYSLTMQDHSPNTLLINTRSKKGHLKVFIDAYKNGCVRFETMNVKNLTQQVIKMILT